MVWLVTFSNCLLAYRLIRGKFKSVDYIAMLQDKLVPCMELNYGNNLNIVEDVWKLISDIVYNRHSFQNTTEFEEVILNALTYVQANKMDAILDLYKGIRKRSCTVLCKREN